MFSHYYHIRPWELNELTLKQFAGMLIELKEIFYYFNGRPEQSAIRGRAPTGGGMKSDLTFEGFRQRLKAHEASGSWKGGKSVQEYIDGRP